MHAPLLLVPHNRCFWHMIGGWHKRLAGLGLKWEAQALGCHGCVPSSASKSKALRHSIDMCQ